ncbi:hypothetical protein AMAG_00122 [Allomyces macrogynus ATCC 38327]|uniref:Uncharacterized protein n=1 Tax=Allomyces macrogynus (strain ATCC 38327) TaxID=578462 RepID=A0A0L0RVG0_ALLM3|nr:hypothetical protein AMAG_00122 [Allomyces macrogynus ATCC 38327]|eukprot:KNE54119.1 hypothetical protein AMAG_00122 [Allomyces macrogynus ATCC 38327]
MGNDISKPGTLPLAGGPPQVVTVVAGPSSSTSRTDAMAGPPQRPKPHASPPGRAAGTSTPTPSEVAAAVRAAPPTAHASDPSWFRDLCDLPPVLPLDASIARPTTPSSEPLVDDASTSTGDLAAASPEGGSWVALFAGRPVPPPQGSRTSTPRVSPSGSLGSVVTAANSSPPISGAKSKRRSGPAIDSAPSAALATGWEGYAAAQATVLSKRQTNLITKITEAHELVDSVTDLCLGRAKLAHRLESGLDQVHGLQTSVLDLETQFTRLLDLTAELLGEGEVEYLRRDDDHLRHDPASTAHARNGAA